MADSKTRPFFIQAIVALLGVLLGSALLVAPVAPALADDGDALAAGSTQLSATSNEVTAVWATVTQDQAAARSLLDMVNAERAKYGVSPLAWDSSLEWTALQRAAEITVRYDSSHARPDGSPWHTAYPDGSSRGENIAAGYSSASSVNTGWINSQGHHENMISTGYNCMAAACSVGANGRMYWVEAFAMRNYDGSYCTTLSNPTTTTVNVLPSNVSLKIVGPDEIQKGQSASYDARIGDASVLSCVTWRSAAPSVASLQANRLTGNATGMTALNARVWESTELSATKNVTVKTYSLADTTVKYEGSEYDYWDWTTGKYEHKLPLSKACTCPATTVVYNGITLYKGTDYSLSYRIDHANAKGIIKLKGLGKFAGTSKTVTFGIIPGDMSWANIQVNGSFTYNGKAKTPKPSVSYYGFGGFVKGLDYTLSYANNVKAGTATVTLVGKGLMRGTRTTTFAISKGANGLKAKAKKASVKYSRKVNRTLAATKYCTVSKANGKVKYKKLSGNKKITVARNGKLTVKKGLKRGTYRVKVRVTASGTANRKAKSVAIVAPIVVK